MLYLNVSEQILMQWGDSIDRYFALYLGGFRQELKSLNLLIEEECLGTDERRLYRVLLALIPSKGATIYLSLEREHCCGEAIEQSFAKAKRYLLRRIKGMVSDLMLAPIDCHTDFNAGQ